MDEEDDLGFDDFEETEEEIDIYGIKRKKVKTFGENQSASNSLISEDK